jgi:twitching motility protein PilJ
MSVLSKIKNLGKRRDDDDLDDSVGFGDPFTSAQDTVVYTGGGAAAQTPLGAPAAARADSSIITEAAPSELPEVAPDTVLAGSSAAESAGARLPLIGHLSAERQQRILWGMLLLSLVGMGLTAVLALRTANQSGAQIAASGQALMQSQRLAKSVSQALIGRPAAFAEVRDASSVLVGNVRSLAGASADGSVPAVEGQVSEIITPLLPLVDTAEKSTAAVLAQEKLLTQVGTALRNVNRQSSDLLELSETVSSLKLQQGASPAELAATGQLVMLTQRIGKSANEFLTVEGVSSEAAFLLGKDLNSFREIAQGLLEGNAELRLPAARDAQTREVLQSLIKTYEQTRSQATSILGNLQGLVSAREAEQKVVGDSEALRKGLEQVQERLQTQTGLTLPLWVLLALSTALLAAAVVGLLRAFAWDQRQRATQSDKQRVEAERQEREAKRVNDANQAAILRLMNELQSVAEGDLTQQATVTEDITGAIADSVNYTVEELRTLVSQVQGTVSRVTQTTQQVEATSIELLAASDEQLREIRETGESVLQMAGRIQGVSAQAQQSAEVARQSLAAAASGLSAVQNTIGGMNSIRDQIQETSKRIKRLGESSQEIGEITELISDITEQTNVLALNAAIQAASAGEAGRGFSVVAEEVQRLAERSGDATRQIAALVKTIQTDTADAVGAMERSTQGVVEGARLSDNAGTALAEIDTVSRRLAELIEQISAQTRREAESANVVAANIQHIFAVTEQTGEGTRSTAQLVRELSRSAEELKQSVSRFKIG